MHDQKGNSYLFLVCRDHHRNSLLFDNIFVLYQSRAQLLYWNQSGCDQDALIANKKLHPQCDLA